jgi:acetyltransferase-like isoleucine patch superfamily enzyme
LIFIGNEGAMNEEPVWLDKVRRNEPFVMTDWDFVGAVVAGKQRAAQVNAFPVTPDNFQEYQSLLRSCFGAVGANVLVQQPVTVDVGFLIEIGDDSFINTNCTLLDTYPIRIGKRVQIGPNCGFYPVGHPVRAAERSFTDPATGELKGITTGAAITVEDDVWVGGHTVVLPGVTIGARSTIGAGSVVTRSIPPDVVAAGTPCRVIRQLN